MQSIQNFISTLGFPIFLSIILIYALWKIYNAVIEALKHTTKTNKDIAETNKKLAETNSKLATHINKKMNTLEHKIDQIADKIL